MNTQNTEQNISTEFPKQPEIDPAASAEPEKIAELEKKCAEWQDKLLRAHAETENVRRRSAIDVEKAYKYSAENFAKLILPVIDSLEKALENKAEESAFEGIRLTLKLFIDTLSQLGITEICPADQPFNPDYHQAMLTQVSAEKAPNTVLSVLQKGYLLHDRVIRPALVVVSKAE